MVKNTDNIIITMKLNNIRDTLQKRKKLRNNMTNEEILLWSRLKKRQFKNIKFRRQHSIDHYILDFYAPEIKLAIEIDGGQHFKPEKIEYDNNRDQFLKAAGIKVIRFTNGDIRKNLSGVLLKLQNIINDIK